MSRDTPSSAVLRLAVALAVGAVGGFAFKLLGLPAPWLSGPGLAVAVVALAGLRIEVPGWLRTIALVFLGVLAGSAVTPQTIDRIGSWPASLAGLAVCVWLVMLSISSYLERVHGYDRATARLSSVPGALPYVLAIAAESSGDVRRVAIVQIMRLLLLVVALPSALAAIGLQAAAPVACTAASVPPCAAPAAEATLAGLLLLAAAGWAGGRLFSLAGAPAPYLFGSMIAVALVTGSGLVAPVLPDWLMIPGVLVIGTMVGANLSGTDRRLLLATLPAGLGSVIVGGVVALGCALPVAMLLDMPLAQVWLAYAPGGVDAMSVMALALGLDTAFVGAHHAARFLGLGVVVPIWLRAYLKPRPPAGGT